MSKTITEWLSTLISFDTTSRNSNLDFIEMIQAECRQRGINDLRITYDASKQKANLVVTLPAKHREGGLILSGHTDVVPVDGQNWTTPPFQAVQKGERIYGRGTCDMKGFLAVILSLLPQWQSQELKKPLHLAFSFDEEVGCRGMPLLIDDLKNSGFHPAACIVGEPTSMELFIANKGVEVVRCRVRGFAAHSSLTPQGCNAIEYAAQCISYLRNLADNLKKNPVSDPLFDIPFVTLSTNQIYGGIAVNTIPENCEFSFEFRSLPGFDPQTIYGPLREFVQTKLLPAMRKENPQAEFEIDVLASVPSFQIEAKASIVHTCRQILHNIPVRKANYTTEAGLFQSAGIPTILCGPGDIDQAHKADEFVTLDQLEKCRDFLQEVHYEKCLH